MNIRISALFILYIAFALAPAVAAEYAPSAHEVWSGIYRCGPMQSDTQASPAYTSSIRMIVEGTSASISKQSGDITEKLSGEIRRDGTVRLEGTGTRRDSASAGWRYRYDGRFEGTRFEARGTMLSANQATRLRDCSMTLVRMQSTDKPARSGEAAVAAPEPAPREAAPTPAPQSQTPVRDTAPAQDARKPRRVAGVPQAVDKELDFSDRNDTATMEGTVARGAPHRYYVVAQKSQRLSATLQSDEGARFDLYEPGSSLTMLSGGFIVQGARLAGSEEGTHVDTTLPADGRYLLLVRSAKEPAFYTLDVAVDRVPTSLLERWWDAKKAWIAAAAAAALILLMLILRRRKRDRRMFGPD